MIHIRDHYIPALRKSHISQKEIYEQVKQLLVDCNKLFITFVYGKECELNETLLRKALGLE